MRNNIKGVVPKGFKPWKKGQSGNPEGARKHDPVKRAIKRLTSREVALLGAMVLKGDNETLREKARGRGTTVALESMIARLALDVIQDGSTRTFEVLFDRLVGPVPVKKEITGKDGGPIRTSDAMTADELRAEIAKLDRLAGEVGED